MTDLIVNSDNDLQIIADDIAIGRSNEQHKEHLLITEPGSIKEFPTAGVGLFGFIESEDEANMIATVRRQFASDGIDIKSISYSKGKLLINGDYNS